MMASDTSAAPRRTNYRYFDLILAAFVATLILSNLIGVGKVVSIAGLTFGASALFFPVSYVIGDVLTEVYGYAYARRAVWVGFGALIAMSLMSAAVLALPAAPDWDGAEAYAYVFSQTPRIVAASIVAFWLGEFANAFVLARLKILTKGRHLWTRTIGSTVIGQGVDSAVFFPLAFWGVWPTALVVTVMITNFALKVLWEIFATPVTYFVVGRLKKAEREDYYDTKTDFSPFKLS